MENKIYLGDCLDIMQDIPDKSIDMILCDLPFGITGCKWDIIIPFHKLWNQYERIIKDRGVIVLNGSQPFTSKLIMSNLEMFKYELIWEKSRASNFVHSNYQPLKSHENIIIFSKGGAAQGSKFPMIYNKQMTTGVPYNKGVGHKENLHLSGKMPNRKNIILKNESGDRTPKSVIYFSCDSDKDRGLHPTQKPVPLLEYLIKTYSNENDLILDNCMGSGSTIIGCLNTNRRYIGIEREKKYFDISQERITAHTKLSQ